MISALVLALWVIAGYSRVPPARAIGEPVAPDEVWSWSRGRSWRVVLASFMPGYVLSLALTPLDLLTRGGPETLAFRWLPSAFLTLVIGVITAVTLSCTYRRPLPG